MAMFSRASRVLGVFALSAGLWGLGGGWGGVPVALGAVLEAPQSAQALRVVVSIAPLKEFAERMAPPGSTVRVLIPPGVSEHGYEIPPRALAALADADVVVYVGLGLEPQVPKFLRDKPRAGRQDVELAAAAGLEADEHEHHHHAPGEPCTGHGGTDPHVWLDPQWIAEHAMPAMYEAVKKALEHAGGGRADVEALAALESRANDLRADLARLHAEYASRLAPAPSRTIVVGHDAFGWMAQRYGLTTVAVHGLGAQEPTPSQLALAKRTVGELGLKVVFSEPQLSPRAARRVAEATGARVVTLDPLGDGTYFAFMRRNLEALCEALACGPAAALGPANDAGTHVVTDAQPDQTARR